MTNKRTIGVGLVTEELDWDLPDYFPTEYMASARREQKRLQRQLNYANKAEELWTLFNRLGIPKPDPELTSHQLTGYWIPILDSFPEDSPLWFAAAWLREYEDYTKARAKLEAAGCDPEALNKLTLSVHEMGSLDDAETWRVRPVLGTYSRSAPLGPSREELALAHLPFQPQNRGKQSRTEKRQEFLRGISADGDNWTYEAIANHAVKAHAREVAELWGSDEGKAERQIVSFLKNHGLR